MNATSSRALTNFQVILTQTAEDRASGKAMDKGSVISLIDLASSERADRTGAMGDRLKKGCAIPLIFFGSSLGMADRAAGQSKKFVPHRDSVLICWRIAWVAMPKCHDSSFSPRCITRILY